MTGVHQVIITRQIYTGVTRLSSSKSSAIIDSIIRVDHAGELGADRIYAGQMAVLGNTKSGPTIKHMWEQEKVHKAKFEELIRKYRVRPTVMVPFWNIAGFALGAGTALLGEKAAMACTVAVESVIVDHYNDQLRTLMSDPEANKELMDAIQKFRDEEQEHHDCGLEHGAEQAPFYQALTQVIKVGCKAAIAVSKNFLQPNTINSSLTCRTYTTSANNTKWDLLGAVCVERKPLLTKPFNDLESKFLKILNQIEYENSHKSDHEIRHEKDVKTLELLKKQVEDLDMDSQLMQTAQDFEDACTDEFNKFKPAPKVTEVDLKNDLRSIDRKLDLSLVLLINEKLGNKNIWLLPQCARSEGETLRQTADRCLQTYCPDVKATILGNAPFGFYKYKYPKTVSSQSVGAKIFFYKAIYVSGNLTTSNFQWSTRQELSSLLTNEDYLKSISMFLIDENAPQTTSQKV